MSFDPGEGLAPIIELSHCFSGVIEQAACLEVVGGDNRLDLFGVLRCEESIIITFKEVKRIRLGVSLNE